MRMLLSFVVSTLFSSRCLLAVGRTPLPMVSLRPAGSAENDVQGYLGKCTVTAMNGEEITIISWMVKSCATMRVKYWRARIVAVSHDALLAVFVMR